MRNPNSFGDLLRSLREQAGKTLKDLAGPMGWSIVYLSDIERGKRNPPSTDDILKIAMALGVKATTLLDSANRQRNRVELNIGSEDCAVADAALMLARRWTDLTEDEAREIMKILDRPGS
jgi:Predicted transcriptional regulators